MKKLDQLDFPSLWMGDSSRLKSLQKSEIFADNGMLQQR